MRVAAGDGGTLYMGAADGGVWKTTNGGGAWTPLTNDEATLSTGALAVNPADHSLWVGTGEANTRSDSYAGVGVQRSGDGGATFARVGGDELNSHLLRRLVFDGQGSVYAATSRGLYKRPAADLTSPRTLVLKPCIGQHDTTYISDVVVRPGTQGRTGRRGRGLARGLAVQRLLRLHRRRSHVRPYDGDGRDQRRTDRSHHAGVRFRRVDPATRRRSYPASTPTSAARGTGSARTSCPTGSSTR